MQVQKFVIASNGRYTDSRASCLPKWDVYIYIYIYMHSFEPLDMVEKTKPRLIY
jgi:hypothetical protein